MRRPMRRIYIYIYEKMKYFFGYAPRLCAATFEIQNGSSFGMKRKRKRKRKIKRERERERGKERERETHKKKERERLRKQERKGRKYAPRGYAPGTKGPLPYKRPYP